MLAKQYVHRLPANYDMELIRARAAKRGSDWDATEGLVFKAFVVQDKGRYEAAGNAYSSAYLWSDERAAARFLMGERFQGVIDMFGRPQVEVWLPLDARRGPASDARFLYRDDIQLRGGADREAELQAEARRNQDLSEHGSTYVTIAALDALHWRLTRLVLSSAPPEPRVGRATFEVLYLARPGLSELPR